MFQNPFSFNGRIRRTEYGISILLYYAILLALSIFLGPEEGSEMSTMSALIFVVVFIPLIWFQLAQGAKRCHDLGNNGWWQIIPFYFLWLLFVEGRSLPNEYGGNPKYVSSFTPAEARPLE